MNVQWTIVAVSVLFLAGCAGTVPPSELVFARAAYAHISGGQAKALVPGEVLKAGDALALAEESFKNEPTSFETRDLAYAASRSAHRAEQLGITAARATKAYATPTSNSAETILLRLPDVTEDSRGLVVTLSGDVLFASDHSSILPAGRDRLDHIALALMTMRERRMTVEGYTDARGSAEHNAGLSQRRADAVRIYLISRGCASGSVLASGMGEAKPVADNRLGEARSINSRVEIIIASPTLK